MLLDVSDGLKQSVASEVKQRIESEIIDAAVSELAWQINDRIFNSKEFAKTVKHILFMRDQKESFERMQAAMAEQVRLIMQRKESCDAIDQAINNSIKNAAGV
jgi:K+/H+ antiporter YhaU regulatory subunit KhtT